MLSDQVLVEKIKTDRCEESLKTVIERHSPLYFSICQKYTNKFSNKGINVQDVFDDVKYVIYQAALTFKPNRNTKFSSWVGTFTRYHCLTLLHKTTDLPNLDYDRIQPDEIIQPKDYTSEYILDILGQLKDKRVKSIFEMRYLSNGKQKTWKEISKAFNISDQTAINLHEKNLNFLKSKVKSNLLLDTI